MAGWLSRIADIFKTGEKVILPPEEQEKPRKLVRIHIFHMSGKGDIETLRPKIRDYPLIFINIERVKNELRPIVSRLKLIAKQEGAQVLGLDTRWLLITKFEVEKKSQ